MRRFLESGFNSAYPLLLLILCVSESAAREALVAYPGYSGDYEGFTLILDERFEHWNDRVWAIGDGAVGNEAMCRFQPRGVRLRDGILELEIGKARIPAGWSEDHQKQKKAYDYYCGELRSRPERRLRYGRIEARMQAPRRQVASGYIASLFTYINEDSPELGREWEEIDIELEGGRPDAFQTNLIYGIDAQAWIDTRRFGAWEQKLPSAAVDQWRVFAIEWLPDRINWYVDGELRRTLTQADTDCLPHCIAPQEMPTPIPDTASDVMINFWIPNDKIENVFGGNKGDNRYPMRARYDWLRIYQYDKMPLANWSEFEAGP